MKSLRPGDPVAIELPCGMKLEAKALSFNSKRALLDLMQKFKTAESGLERLNALESAVGQCLGQVPDGLLDKIDEVDAMAIITETLQAGMLSEDERKKSE